ncbi:hypothetical protein J8L70_09925 [Pseudoalteromonas sp. MMG010]|uniref:hypothetical protein n=1 Tax=Pseudoalteromonas sp. MMG010 TaxID=2822685 RepID=UPI001B39EE1F|nr:hypothetical protein [Pseudoalteromonas sp. MMG010]MBQ4833556.1 hypothetical protein [Pseudoalteromonas sp. MMG010]
MIELSTFDLWFYVLFGIALALGGFFLFYYYNNWVKRQLEDVGSSFIRGSLLVWFIGFGISLTGVGVTYIFGSALFSFYFS